MVNEYCNARLDPNYSEANLFEDFLEVKLFLITTMDSISKRTNNFTLTADTLPEFTVIKLPGIGLPGGVIDVLHIDKYSDFFHLKDRSGF